MTWGDPVTINLPPNTTPFQRLVAMLGHYDLRYYFSETGYVDVGAGSLGSVPRIHGDWSVSGCLGEIGRFCQVNPSAHILAGGEHDNESPVNVTFADFPGLQGFDGLKPAAPFKIGSGVVISANAIVLNNVTIGDGVVIGAGAVAARDCEALGIYVGSPARLVRHRPRFAPWWDWEPAYLLENKHRLQELARDLDAPHRYRVTRPRFCIRSTSGDLKVFGFAIGDEVSPLASAPSRVIEYVAQAITSEKPYWLADCWTMVGERRASDAA